MGNSIKPNIERAEKTGACNLSLQNLREFPDVLTKLSKCLRTLDLSGNKLIVIPGTIGSFAILKNLNLSNNSIENLPNEISGLAKLETLNLSSNRLTSLPQSINRLQLLRDIDISNNQLSTFPTQLCQLKNLDNLNLFHNKIGSVPADVAGLTVLELNLNQNRISQLSEAVCKCPRLRVLRLEENCLDVAAFTPKILRDSNISALFVEGNLFDMKAFHQIDGYDQYMERYSATRRKLD